MLSQVLTIARAELLRRIRSRSAVITAIVAPLALAIVFGLMFDTSSAPSFTIGIVDEGGTEASAQIAVALVDSSDEAGSVTFVSVDDRSLASVQVDEGDIGSAVVIGDSLNLTVLTTPASPLSAQVGESVAASIATRIDTGGGSPVQLVDVPVGGRELSAPAYFGASMSILLLFFATGMAAQSILEDKENRTLDRILAGPTTAWAVLIGKVLAVAAMAVLGFVVVWLVTSVIFGAQWGSPFAVLVLIVFTVVALAGVATFIGGFAKTAQQATTMTAVVTFALSLLGGNFTGPADTPAPLRAVRRLTPNGRALEAFTEVSTDAGSIGSISWSLVTLLLFGVVFGAIGLMRIERAVAS